MNIQDNIWKLSSSMKTQIKMTSWAGATFIYMAEMYNVIYRRPFYRCVMFLLFCSSLMIDLTELHKEQKVDEVMRSHSCFC